MRAPAGSELRPCAAHQDDNANKRKASAALASLARCPDGDLDEEAGLAPGASPRKSTTAMPASTARVQRNTPATITPPQAKVNAPLVQFSEDLPVRDRPGALAGAAAGRRASSYGGCRWARAKWAYAVRDYRTGKLERVLAGDFDPFTQAFTGPPVGCARPWRRG